MFLLQSATNIGLVWPVLASAAIKSTALLLAAGLLALALRKTSAAARHGLWLLALCGALTLPLLSVTLPQWKVLPPQPALEPPAMFDASTPTPIAPVVIYAPSQPMTDNASASIAESVPHPAPAPIHAPINWPACAVIAWAIGAAVMLAPVVLGMAALFRLRSRSQAIDDEDWTDLLEKLSAQLNIVSPVRLLQSDCRSMPMIWGIRRPTILLPTESHDWPDQRKRLVLLHELAHVKRRDGLTQLIAQFARALYWFNPFAWFAVRQLEVERERACDDMVLIAGNKPSDYAAELLAVATGYRTAAIAGLVAAPMARPSNLENRLRAILDIRQNRQNSTRRAIAIGLIALLIMLLPLAAIHSRAASPAAAVPKTLDENDPMIVELTQAARNDIDAGNYNAALNVLDQIITLDPSNTYAVGVRQFVVDRAIVAAQRKAREAFDRNLAANAAPPAATQPTTQPATAQQIAQRDQTVAALVQAAKNDINAGDYNAAFSIVDQIIVLDPTNEYAGNVRRFVADRAAVIAEREAREAFDKNSAPNATRPAATQPAQSPLDKVLPESNFNNAPFNEVIDYLRDTTGANIFVNTRALEAAGFDQSTPITLKLHNVKFSKALEVILDMAGGQTKLGYKLDEGVITISTADQLDQNVDTMVYDVRDLIEPLPNSKESSADLLNDVTKLVTDVVAPASWKASGGKVGSISVLPGKGQLVVTQTPENHEEILELLDKIREGREQGIVRMLAKSRGPDVAVVHPPANDPWKGTLPNGVTVELVGLSQNPSKGRPWWKPDGTALAERPYDDPIGGAPPNSQRIERRIVMRLSNSSSKEVGTLWQFDPAPSASASWGAVTWSGIPSDGLCAAMITEPIEQLGITIRFAVAAGPWRNVAESDTPSNTATDQLADGDVVFAPAIQGDNQVAVTVTTAALIGEQLRLVAVDRAGAEHVADGGSGASYKGDQFSQINSGFRGMKINDIASIRVEARRYEWIEFNDVALWRGK